MLFFLTAIKNDLIQSSKIIFIFVELLTFNNDKTFFIPIHASHLRKYAIKHSQVNIKSKLPSLSASHVTCVFIVHGFWEMRIFLVCNVRGVIFLCCETNHNNTNTRTILQLKQPTLITAANVKGLGSLNLTQSVRVEIIGLPFFLKCLDMSWIVVC